MEMESNQNSDKMSSPLFPAFSLPSSNNMQSTSLFPAFNTSSTATIQPTPLFPAYGAETQSTGDVRSEREWLCNSSYSPSNTEIVYSKQEDILQTEKHPTDRKEKIRHAKKNKREKNKKPVIPHPSSFEVPESDSIRSYLSKKTFIEETGLSFERAYRVDPKCDPENIHFEHLEQKNIAKYKLYPRTPIGLTLEQQDHWPKPPISKYKNVFSRYFGKKAVKLLKNISPLETINMKNTDISDATLKFIPLSQDRKTSIAIRDYTKEGYDGISTSWKLHSSQKTDSKEISDDEPAVDSELRNRTIYFNKKLSESPHDIQLWLEFVDFQDELYLSEKREDISMPYTESAVIEKKIAILDKALSYNPRSVKLNVFKLNLCRSVWKLEKQIQCWDELVFLNPNNVEVWQEYFIFILTNVTYFTTSRVLKLYSKCLTTLSNLSEGIIQSHEAPPDIVPKMIDIFSQMCFVLKSCGYVERAVGAFQALIELNVFGEKAIEILPISDQISFLEPFWDSGAARFGEDGAIGWAATVSEKKITFDKIVTQSDLSNMEDDILNDKHPQWETWLKFEKLRELHHWMPWRPNPEYDQTDDDLDDMDRNVSFDDVSKFLFRVSKEEHKFMLLLQFIKFLGFNPHNFGCNISSQNTKNRYIDIENFDITSKTLKDTLFNKICSPLCLEENIWTKDRFDFVNNIFSQILCKLSSKYKTLVSLMQLKFYQKFAVKNNNQIIKTEDAKKFAKSMLKESNNRNCLLLWLEFIKMESLNSKTKSKKTFETLVASSCNAIAEGTMAVKELWYFVRSYLDLCFGIQDYSFVNTKMFSREEIISLLVCISCREKFAPFSDEFTKPTFILKAGSCFKSFIQQELQLIVSENLEICSCIDPGAYPVLDCTKCFAYLQYFSQGIDAAMLIFKDITEFCEVNLQEASKKYLLEQFNVLQADLLNFNTWNSTASIKPLQTFLQESVSNYPNSSRLLHYLIKLKSASSVVSPTRRFFAKILKRNTKLQPNVWIFALASELSILNSIINQQSITMDQTQCSADQSFCQGINWKIRALYERALELPSCSNIPFLWRSYIKFEISNNEAEKAKSIYHRAMQNCSWSKDLIMDGVEYFHDNLKQVIDFMVEKQMRIHTPLEEITLLMEHCIQED